MENPDQAQTPSELDVLKSRARMMGIEFSNNIGLESLKKKVNDKLSDTSPANVDLGNQPAEPVNALEVGSEIASNKDTAAPMGADFKQQIENTVAPKAPETERQKQTREQLRLVRIRIQNLDPKKKDLPGEIITLANEVLGTVRKFVPYGEVTDDGYHVPYIIYRHLEKRKFLNIRTSKDRRTGTPTVSHSWAKEFSIEVLDPLTQEELNRLAAAQAAAGSMN